MVRSSPFPMTDAIVQLMIFGDNTPLEILVGLALFMAVARVQRELGCRFESLSYVVNLIWNRVTFELPRRFYGV
jgi:hypothetical protein